MWCNWCWHLDRYKLVRIFPADHPAALPRKHLHFWQEARVFHLWFVKEGNIFFVFFTPSFASGQFCICPAPGSVASHSRRGIIQWLKGCGISSWEGPALAEKSQRENTHFVCCKGCKVGRNLSFLAEKEKAVYERLLSLSCQCLVWLRLTIWRNPRMEQLAGKELHSSQSTQNNFQWWCWWSRWYWTPQHKAMQKKGKAALRG